MRRNVRNVVRAGVWTAFLIAGAAAIVGYLLEARYEAPLDAQSFRFERPWAALLLVAALLVFIARSWLQRDAAPRLWVSRGQDLALSGRGRRAWLRESLTGLRVTATALLVFALMGPQSIHARDSVEVEGIDIVLTLDTSLSMQAADIVPDRFTAMKEVVDEFLLRRPNDRIGAVIFGRDAYTLLPLTTDKEALRTTIAELELGIIDGRGTAIGNALGVSLNRLRGSNAKTRTIILLTDGDSNSGNVSPEQAAQFASTMGVKVFTILMGQTDEARVQRGVDLFGRPLWDRGQFPVNPALLKKMAGDTGGEFFQATDRASLERSFHAILDRLQKTEIEDPGRIYAELFPAFLAPALVFFAIELLLGALFLRRWP